MSISALCAVYPSHNGLSVSSKPLTFFLSLLCQLQRWLRRTTLTSSGILWTSPPWPASQQGAVTTSSILNHHQFSSPSISHLVPFPLSLCSLLPLIYLFLYLFTFTSTSFLLTCLPLLQGTNIAFYYRFPL